jgi:putative membrane protein
MISALLFSNVLGIAAFAQSSSSASNDRSSSDRTAASTAVSDSSSSKLDWSDKRFVTKATKAGMEEVSISRVAAERATNPEVKALAQKIVSDHESVNRELTTVAGNRGVSLSDSMEKHDDRLVSKWQKKDAGTDFDKAYLKEMVSDHEDAIELFGKAAKSEDAQIASLASKTLPALQEHLTRAKELQKSLGY